MAVIRGIASTTRNLNRAIAMIEGNTREGMLQGVLFLRSEAVPLTPIETGTLRGSSFTDITAPGVTPIRARVGYTAEYAPYVHEMVRRSGVAGPRQDRTTAAFVGPRQKRRFTFVGPRKPRGRDPKHRPWKPGTGPKFLQRAVMENRREFFGILLRYARIKDNRAR